MCQKIHITYNIVTRWNNAEVGIARPGYLSVLHAQKNWVSTSKSWRASQWLFCPTVVALVCCMKSKVSLNDKITLVCHQIALNDAMIVLEALQKHMKTLLCNQWQFFSEMRISWCQQTRMLDSKVESIFFGWNSKILRASEEWSTDYWGPTGSSCWRRSSRTGMLWGLLFA